MSELYNTLRATFNCMSSLFRVEKDLHKKKADDCTSFYVYANATEISCGQAHPVLGYITASPYNSGVSIPAQMTCKFALRSKSPKAESDVTIDWGDGSITDVAKDDIDWNQTDDEGEVCNVVAHTYAEEGKYKVTIYGHKYFNVAHHLSVATQHPQYANDNLDDNKICNLLCECLDDNCSLASNITNLAGFARCSQRLTSVNVTNSHFFEVQNMANMFLSCWNLLTFSGVGKYIPCLRNCSGLFSDCRNMTSCEFVLPACSNDSTCLVSVFNNCNKLSSKIEKLIPDTGFSANKLAADKTFRNCSSLTGKIPAKLLWQDNNIEWIATSTCFEGCSLAPFAPVSWGGQIQDSYTDDVPGYTAWLPLENDAYEKTGKDVRMVQDANNPIQFTVFQGKKCTFFDGNGVIVLPNFGEYSNKSFSVCFWLAKNSSAQWEGVVSKRYRNGRADYYFGFNYDIPGQYNSVWSSSAVTLSKNLWNHICYVNNANTTEASIYINGKFVKSFGANSICSTNSENNLIIGAGCGYGDYMAIPITSFSEMLHGYLRQVRVYPSALNKEQIEMIMAKTDGGKHTSITEVIAEGSQPQNLTLSPEHSYYYWDLTNGGGTSVLTCADTIGVGYSWDVDIVIPVSGVDVSLGSMFTGIGSDVPTSGVVNHCIVRWNGRKAVLKVLCTS